MSSGISVHLSTTERKRSTSADLLSSSSTSFRRELLKAFIGELARNVVLIEPLEDSIRLCDPLLGIDKLPFPLCNIPVALPQVTVHDQPHKLVLTAGGEGNDLPRESLMAEAQMCRKAFCRE